MANTDTLTFGQGIRILVEIVVFIVIYFLYLKLMQPDEPFFINLIVTTVLFAIWLFSVSILSNISMALTVPSTREASVARRASDPGYQSLFPSS